MGCHLFLIEVDSQLPLSSVEDYMVGEFTFINNKKVLSRCLTQLQNSHLKIIPEYAWQEAAKHQFHLTKDEFVGNKSFPSVVPSSLGSWSEIPIQNTPIIDANTGAITLDMKPTLEDHGHHLTELDGKVVR